MSEQFVSLLSARMRAHGATVGVGQVLEGQRALAAVPPAAARDALRATLCASRSDLAAFDAAWATLAAVEPPAGPLDELLDAAREVLPRAGVPSVEVPAPVPGELAPVPAADSAEELLLHKDFADYTDAERAAARALLARLARRGERHDVRATVRASLRRGGELLDQRWRVPGERERLLVLIIDVSGSMAPYARVLLQYAQAAVAARRRVEAFALGTRITRITRELAGRDPDRALHRATEAVIDLGGGTRIGASLGELNRVHGRRLGRGAFVVVLSDGWDRGEPDVLAAEMARLRRTAHRLVWLNPLAADPSYQPLTRGMRAALPHTDHLLPGNSIASLEALADLMESAT